ncbi:MAG: alpha/beta hydrolase [Arenicella sp.]|jgi:pimeloyl-ACP methyl ester carboxylesterase|nr:alpha/beta hydrolase [Arenicella sp.]
MKLSLRLALALAVTALLVSLPSFSVEDRHVEYPTYSAHANGISIAYQDFDVADGVAEKGTILLVMGLGAQLVNWNDDLVLALADEGYRVIRFDNRDAGWSEKFYDAPTPGLFTGIRFKLGWSLSSPYKLDDMAADAIGLVDALGIDKVHVVGASMGGMIAQIMSARYPDRVATLTSIMSTTGAAHLPLGTVDLNMSSDAKSRQELIDGTYKLVTQFGGRAANLEYDATFKRLARYYDRSHYAPGGARQFWAILDSGDRVELLKTVKQPTLVMHGDADALVPASGGEHTAEVVEGSKYVVLKGMGHHIDEVALPTIIKEILEVAALAPNQ